MLHRLTCFVVIFSILRSAYCADEDSRISIAVTGGGYTGVLTSIFLGGLKDKDGVPICDVHLFERNLNLMNGASTLCARRHYGGEYPTDRNTAEQCLFSSLLYQQMFPTEAILTGRRRNDFLVAKESTTTADPDKHLSLDQVHQHYAHLQDLYRTIFAQFAGFLGEEEAARQLFGRPEDFVEYLASPEDIGDERLRSHFAGGVSTKERGFQPFALGVILERLLEQNNVKVHLGCTVENAESVADKGYRLHYSSHGKGTQDFFADYVIGAAWHENPYLNIVAASRGDHPVQGNLATKVYLRSIGLFDVSGCANIPEDRSYFGLKGSPGGMVSFYTSAVAAIYIPEEELSLHGGSELTYDQARKTFLSREVQAHLDDLNGPTALQSGVLNRILVNAQAKYPFLKGANSITLLTRTTVSVDPRVEQRSHVKPIWPLGEGMRWLEAESTKATFSPVTALQVLSEIIRQPDVREKISLSEDAKAFLAALYQLNFLDETGRPRENLLRLPEEFRLFTGYLTEDSDLAAMQLYALKRRLPFAMMEPFARGDMVTIRPDLQIPMINWNVLDDVDLRSISPTASYLRALADAVNALPPHKGFKSFRFKYYGEEMATSLKHAQAGLRLLEALGGDDSSEVRRPIGELEIGQLHLTLEGEAKALLDIIINSALKKLILTRFSTNVSLRDSFILSLDLARSLKSTRVLFQETPSYETVKVILGSFDEAPELSEFMFSNNQLGGVLRGHQESIKFTRLSNFIERSKKLKTLDLSDNELFSGAEDQNKHGIFDAIKDRPTLHVDMGGNGLDPAEETSRKHFLFLKLQKIKAKKQREIEGIERDHKDASKNLDAMKAELKSVYGEYEALPAKSTELQRKLERAQSTYEALIGKIESSKLVRERIFNSDVDALVNVLRESRSGRDLNRIDSEFELLQRDLEETGKTLRMIKDQSRGLSRDLAEAKADVSKARMSVVESAISERDDVRLRMLEMEIEALRVRELMSSMESNMMCCSIDRRAYSIGSGINRYSMGMGSAGKTAYVRNIGSIFGNIGASIGSQLHQEEVLTRPIPAAVKVDPERFNRELFSESVGKIREWVYSGNDNRVSSIYVAFDPEMTDRGSVDRLYDDLVRSGLFDNVYRDEGYYPSRSITLSERIRNADKVLVIGSRELKDRYDSRKLKREDIGVVSYEMDAIRLRLFERGDTGIIPFYFSGNSPGSCFPTTIMSLKKEYSGVDGYLRFFDVLGKIYGSTDNPISKIKREFWDKQKS
jgi:hypothetical protein